MKKRAIFAAAMIALAGLTGCGNKNTNVNIVMGDGNLESLKGSGTSAEKTAGISDGKYKLSVGEFNMSNGEVEVIISSTGEKGCTLKADDNIINELTFEVSGEEIKLRGSDKYMFDSADLTLLVNADVNSIEISGACSVNYDTGAQTDVGILSSGSNVISVKGECENANILLSGSDTLSAYDLTAKNVTITASGSCTAEVYASESLNATAAGASSIVYDGSPASVKDEAAGSSSISAR